MASNLTFEHHVHGRDTHDLVIFLVQRYVVTHGGQLMSGEWFKRKALWTGDPDVVIKYTDKVGKITGQKRNQDFYWVCEVETHATNASVTKKIEQFKNSSKGIDDVIFIKLNGLTREQERDWVFLDEFVAQHMPF